MADFIGELIRYLFSQDRLQHPMSIQNTSRLWDKIHMVLSEREEENHGKN